MRLLSLHSLHALLVLAGLFLAAGLARPATAASYSFSQSISGSNAVPVTVALTDIAGGSAVDITVSIPAGQGDPLGFFGNVTLASLIPQLTVSSPGVVTQWQFASDAVS